MKSAPDAWKKVALSFEQKLSKNSLWLLPRFEDSLFCMRAPINGVELIAGSTKDKKILVQARLPIILQSIRIFKQTFFAKLRTLTGQIDLIVGDKDFDDRFVIRTNNRDITRYLLSPDTREAIEQAQDFTFEVEGEELIGWLDSSADSQTIVAGIKATAAIASRAQTLYQEWGDLCHQLGGTPEKQSTQHHPFSHSITVPYKDLSFSIRHPQNEAEYSQPAMMTSRVIAKAETEAFRISASKEELKGIGGLTEVQNLNLPNGHLVFSSVPEMTRRRMTDTARGLLTEDVNITAGHKEIRLFIKGLVLSRERIQNAMELIIGLMST